MTTTLPLQSETIYTRVAGGITVFLNGERGTTTEFHTVRGEMLGVFVKLDRGAMLYVRTGELVAVCSCGADVLGQSEHNVHCNLPAGRKVERTIVEVREIDRDEFDRIVGLDELRRSFGWA
jgi:hypothetical protein